MAATIKAHAAHNPALNTTYAASCSIVHAHLSSLLSLLSSTTLSTTSSSSSTSILILAVHAVFKGIII